MALEPIPHSDYIPGYGAYFLSAGRTQVYQCLSYPLCRIYWDAGKPTAWKTESAWYDTGDPKKGWRRDGPNFPSFLARIVDLDADFIGEPKYVTLRHKPVWSYEIVDLLPVVKAARNGCQPVRPALLDIDHAVIERMVLIQS